MNKNLNTYSYFDNSSTGINEFVAINEPFRDYWQQSEDYVLDKLFSEYLVNNKAGSLLDIGCGDGRLSEKIYSHFETIVAIDPDKKRIKNARRNIAPKILKKTELVVGDFLNVEFPANFFDCIICCHIIQHIPNRYLKAWFKKIYKLLKPGGVLFLMTSITPAKSDVFVITNNKMQWRKVSQRVFESSYHEKCLIGRQFSENTISKHISKFKFRSQMYYHALYRRNFLDNLIFRDRLLNFTSAGRFFGKKLATDVIIVVGK